MKILITGGNGFVGSYFAKVFDGLNYEVFAPGRKDMDCFNPKSVSNYIKKSNPEIIIHSAAMIIPTDEMHGNHEKILNDNSALNTNVLQQAALLEVKNIFCFGSHTMYSPEVEKTESNILLGSSPSFIKGYADSKRLLLKACNKYCEEGFNYKMLVLPSIYGPFDPNFSPKQMLNSIILRARNLKKDNHYELDVRGDLTALREYIFLPDISTWISQSINIINELPTAMNLGTNSILPILEYYKICSKAFNLHLKYKEEDSLNDELFNNVTPLDYSKASNYGWGVVTPIEEGIMQTIKYINGNYGV